MPDGLASQRFDPDIHDATAFSCGVSGMDAWLQDSADAAARRQAAVTWVWADESRVVAYYSLSAHKVTRDGVPKAIGRGGPVEIPAVLIGKLALDASLHGRGLGGVLLVDALTCIVSATQIVAARLVVVDAFNEAAAQFYQHYGFTRTTDDLRLLDRIKDIRADLDE